MSLFLFRQNRYTVCRRTYSRVYTNVKIVKNYQEPSVYWAENNCSVLNTQLVKVNLFKNYKKYVFFYYTRTYTLSKKKKRPLHGRQKADRSTHAFLCANELRMYKIRIPQYCKTRRYNVKWYKQFQTYLGRIYAGNIQFIKNVVISFARCMISIG